MFDVRNLGINPERYSILQDAKIKAYKNLGDKNCHFFTSTEVTEVPCHDWVVRLKLGLS